MNGKTNFDIWTLPMNGDHKAVPYLRGPSVERGGRLSPDGRWMAYYSNETGQDEVYVQSFPELGHKVRVSANGGQYPRWVEAGRALRYGNSGAVVTVPVTVGEEIKPGTPQVLQVNPTGVTGTSGSVDGNSRLLSIATTQRPRDIRLILDLTALLGR